MNHSIFKYDIFISYKHEKTDKMVAQYLQRALEQYKIPKEIQKKTGKEKIKRVFRDEEELSVASDLSEEIEDQLKQTEFLLVVCSKKTKDSIWVQREIATFLKYRSRRYILPVLVDGEPEESFPKIILDGGEPLAADLRGKNEKEILKNAKQQLPRILAPVLRCSYDELKQRHKAYQMKRLAWITGAIALVSVMFGAYSVKQNLEIKENYTKKLENQSRYLAQTANELLDSGDREAAMLVALEALPESEADDSRPLVAEARMALENSLYLYQDPMKSYLLPYKKIAHSTEIADELLCYNGQNSYILTKDSDSSLYVWEAETMKPVCTWNENPWRQAAFNRNGMVIADSGEKYVKSEDDRLLCKNPASGDILWEKQPYVNGLSGYDWDYSEASNQVVLLQYTVKRDYSNPDNDNTELVMTFINGDNGEEKRLSFIKQGKAAPEFICLSPNGTRAAVMYCDSFLTAEEAENEICIYDCSDGKLLFSEKADGWLESGSAWLDEDIFAAGFVKEYSMGLTGNETEWKVAAYNVEQQKKIWEYQDLSLNLNDRMLIESLQVEDENDKEEKVVSIVSNNIHVVINLQTGVCYNRMEAHNMIQDVVLLGGKSSFLYFMQTGDVFLSGVYETYTFNPIWTYNYELGVDVILDVAYMDSVFYVAEGQNLHTYKVASEIEGIALEDTAGLLDVAYSPDGMYFYGTTANTLELFRTENGKKLAKFPYKYSGHSHCFADEDTLAVITPENILTLYHIGEEKEEIIFEMDSYTNHIRSMGENKLLAWNKEDYYILDARGKQVDHYTKKELQESFLSDSDELFTADEMILTDSERFLLFVDSGTGSVSIWDREEEQPVDLPECGNVLLAEQDMWSGFYKGFDKKSVRGDEVIFYGKDKKIRIFDIAKGEITFELETDGVGNQFVVFTPDGKQLVFINSLNQLRVVDRRTKEYTVNGLERLNLYGTAYFEFSKDGKELYVRSVENLSTPIMVFYEQKDSGAYIKQTEIGHCYGTDGEKVLIRDAGPVYLTEKYELDQLIAIAKKKLEGRVLTPEEKMEYLVDQ